MMHGDPGVPVRQRRRSAQARRSARERVLVNTSVARWRGSSLDQACDQAGQEAPAFGQRFEAEVQPRSLRGAGDGARSAGADQVTGRLVQRGGRRRQPDAAELGMGMPSCLSDRSPRDQAFQAQRQVGAALLPARA